MLEAQDMGMQGLSCKGIKGLACVFGQQDGLGPETRPVGVVAEQRMPDMGQMHPDLMRPPGLQPAGGQGGDRFAVVSVVFLKQFPVCNGLTPILPDSLLVACVGVAAERRLDGPLRPVRRAPDESQVLAFEVAGSPMIGKLAR